MKKLSICFTVYNQIDILKTNLDLITKYKNDDIEIVVSDDCSTDRIEDLVISYNDKRIAYFKTESNIGHDLNILHGLRCCKSNYVYIFRTRDNIYVENIPKIIKIIEDNPKVGFYYFSAFDEEGNLRLNFKDHFFEKGFDIAKNQKTIPIHPSGNLYNKTYLQLDLYEKYIRKYFSNNYGFIVHQLIRYDLSAKADFLTSSTIGWIYADTLRASDVAVNKSKNGINVYAPIYCYPRYKCEFEFDKNELPREFQLINFINIVHFYYVFIIYKSPMIVQDPRYNKHYTSNKENINIKKELKTIEDMTIMMISDLPQKSKEEITKKIKKDIIFLKLLYPFMTKIRNRLIGTKAYKFYRKGIAYKKR